MVSECRSIPKAHSSDNAGLWSADSRRGVADSRFAKSVAKRWETAIHAVRNIIRENHLYSLENCLQTSAKEGMTTMDNCLLDLYRKCLISYDCAMSRARHPEFMSKAG